MNIFWKYRGNDEFPTDLIDDLIGQRIVNKIIIETKHIDRDYVEKHPQIIAFENAVVSSINYNGLISPNEVEALNDGIIRKMRQFESTAIQLGVRKNNLPNTIYELERRNYLIHLRVWHHMFKKYEIDAAFFSMTPHNQGDYVIYALAKALGLPTIVCSPTALTDAINGPSVFAWGDSIESVGTSIKNTYLSKKRLLEEELELEGRIKDFFDVFYNKPLEAVKQIKNPGADRDTVAEAKKQAKHFFTEERGKRPVMIAWLKMQYNRMKNVDLSSKVLSSERDYYKRWGDHFFYKYFMEEVPKSYKWTHLPDFNEKYIYYALSFFPEETTLPRSLLYDQLTVIQLLSRIAAKRGMKVYVKDHPHLLFRDKQLYLDIMQLANVKIIRANYPTYDIISNSVACATLNGSVLLEGVLLGKPVLVFDDSYMWHGMPGVFRIKNEKEGADIIESLVCGYKMDPVEVKRYFAAIQDHVIIYDKKNKDENIKTALYSEKNTNQIRLLIEKLKRMTDERSGTLIYD